MDTSTCAGFARRVRPAAVRSRALAGFAAVALATGGVVATSAAPAAASPGVVPSVTASVNGTVYAVAQSGSRIYLGGIFSWAGTPVGQGAILRRSDGRRIASIPKFVGTVRAAVPDGAGGWYVGGDFTRVGGKTRAGLARVSATGVVSSWTSPVTGSVRALAVDGSRVLVGGAFSAVNGTPRANLAALDATTGAVLGWAPTTDGVVNEIERRPGGDVYVAGAFGSAGGAAHAGLAALDPLSGSARAWSPAVNGEVRAVELSADGTRVFAGGTFTAAGGQPRSGLAALDATSGAASAWDPAPDGPVNALALAGDGSRLFAAGGFGRIAGVPRGRGAALDPVTGAADAWNPQANGTVTDLDVSAADTAVLLAGEFTAAGGGERYRTAALNTTTGDAEAWSPGADAVAHTIARSGTNVFVGGEFTSINGAARRNLAAVDALTGDVDAAFHADTDNVVRAVAVAASTNTVYLGGEFTTVDGHARSRIAAVDAGSGGVRAWAPTADGTVHALGLSGSILYAGGAFYTMSGVSARRLARIDAVTGSVDRLFKPRPDGAVRALVVTPDGSTLFPVGSYKIIAGVTRPGAAALDATTGAVNGFAPTTGGAAIAAALSPDTDTIYFSTSSNRMYAYDHATGNTPRWTLRTGGDVQAIAATATEVYVGGHFTNFPDQKVSRPHLGSVYPDTGLATGWNPTAGGELGVWALTATADALLCGGDFSTIGGRNQQGFAQFPGAP